LWQVLPPRYFVRFGIGRRGEWAARHSVTLRRAYLAVAFKMWQQRPLLGWGDQGFRAEGRDHLPGRLIRRKDIAVHNDYLRTMTNQGMVGLALLGAVLWLAYRNYSAAEARAPAGGGTAVTAVKLYFLVWIASAMLGNGLFETAPFYLLCGLSAALAGTPGRRLCGVARGSRGQARGLASRQAHVPRPRGPSESRTVEAL